MIIDRFCTKCGTAVKVDENAETFECPSCHNVVKLNIGSSDTKESPKIDYSDLTSNTSGYYDASDVPPSSAPKKKAPIWLWVLGWLFIFPLPLSILIFRNQKMNNILRAAIMALAWSYYLIYFAEI